MKLSFALFRDMWVVGEPERINQKWYLKNPCIYLFNNKEHGMMSLPGKPDIIATELANLVYENTDKEIESMYKRKTTKLELPTESNIIV